MPRLHHRKARKDIYENGKETKAKNKQGFTLDRSKPANKKDKVIIKAGEMYYTWHPKGSGWQYSKTKPDLRSYWDKTYGVFEDRVNDKDELGEDEREDLKSEIESERGELQNNLDNMPEQLQESSVLNERIEQLEELISQLEE